MAGPGVTPVVFEDSQVEVVVGTRSKPVTRQNLNIIRIVEAMFLPFCMLVAGTKFFVAIFVFCLVQFGRLAEHSHEYLDLRLGYEIASFVYFFTATYAFFNTCHLFLSRIAPTFVGIPFSLTRFRVSNAVQYVLQHIVLVFVPYDQSDPHARAAIIALYILLAADTVAWFVFLKWESMSEGRRERLLGQSAVGSINSQGPVQAPAGNGDEENERSGGHVDEDEPPGVSSPTCSVELEEEEQPVQLGESERTTERGECANGKLPSRDFEDSLPSSEEWIAVCLEPLESE